MSWKPCQGDSLNLPDHRIHKDGDGDASFQLKSNSLPHAHAQTTKTFYKHQDSRIMKAQELKDKDFRTNSDIQDLPSKISSLSREIILKIKDISFKDEELQDYRKVWNKEGIRNMKIEDTEAYELRGENVGSKVKFKEISERTFIPSAVTGQVQMEFSEELHSHRVTESESESIRSEFGERFQRLRNPWLLEGKKNTPEGSHVWSFTSLKRTANVLPALLLADGVAASGCVTNSSDISSNDTYNISTGIHPKRLIDLFGEMPEKNVVTYGILVNGLCKWGMLMKSGGITYCLIGRVDEGRKLFDVMMCDHDVISYNVLINGYCKNDVIDKAIGLMDEMCRLKIDPNVVTYTIIQNKIL
ncbi:putative pentatricopeptide repeat-containing protein [Tanacetum coccineum]